MSSPQGAQLSAQAKKTLPSLPSKPLPTDPSLSKPLPQPLPSLPTLPSGTTISPLTPTSIPLLSEAHLASFSFPSSFSTSPVSGLESSSGSTESKLWRALYPMRYPLAKAGCPIKYWPDYEWTMGSMRRLVASGDSVLQICVPNSSSESVSVTTTVEDEDNRPLGLKRNQQEKKGVPVGMIHLTSLPLPLPNQTHNRSRSFQDRIWGDFIYPTLSTIIYPTLSAVGLDDTAQTHGLDRAFSRAYNAQVKKKREEVMRGRVYVGMETLFISPPHQHKGLGTSLVSYCTALASYHALPILLEASEETTPFFERLGFEVVGSGEVEITSASGWGGEEGEGVYRWNVLVYEPESTGGGSRESGKARESATTTTKRARAGSEREAGLTPAPTPTIPPKVVKVVTATATATATGPGTKTATAGTAMGLGAGAALAGAAGAASSAKAKAQPVPEEEDEDEEDDDEGEYEDGEEGEEEEGEDEEGEEGEGEEEDEEEEDEEENEIHKHFHERDTSNFI